MEDTARIVELKCRIAAYFIDEVAQEEYMIEGCDSGPDRTKEYSLFIDLLENQAFLNRCCKIKDIR